jgi:hypothetical protein
MNELAKRTQFQPGQSGNPNGKPPGARNVLSRSLIEDLAAEWAEGGKEAMRVMRVEKPDRFVLAALSILPKDVLVSVQHEEPSVWASLPPEWKRQLAEMVMLFNEIPPTRVLEWMRSEVAKLVDHQDVSPASIESR